MTFFSKLKKILSSDDGPIDEIPSTDSFADNLILEIRRSVSESVTTELEKHQGKYLSSILRKSHLPIEAISIQPCDHETAKNVEEFFRLHSEFDKDFERNFFVKNLSKEYRTAKGAKAILKSDISFCIEPSKLGIDNPTSDETYQINLRGNRRKFTSIVTIGKITSDQIDRFDSAGLDDPKNRSIFPSQVKNTLSTERNSVRKVSIDIHDKNGFRSVNSSLPLILGRTSQSDENYEYKKINIDSKYISRNQFVIVEVLGTIYGFVPKEAKLTAILGRRGTLRPLTLIEISNQNLQMTFGQPLDTALTIVKLENPELYPSVTIRLDEGHVNVTMTPIPNVRKQ